MTCFRLYLNVSQIFLAHSINSSQHSLLSQFFQPVYYFLHVHIVLEINMKTFDVVKSYFRTSGINSYQSTQWHLFNTKNVLFILMLGINLASTCFYSLQEAKKFEDYVDSYFWITTTFAHGLTFVIIIWKLPPLYRFFMDLENIIKNSK